MTITTLKLELDTVLMRSEERELAAIAQRDPQIRGVEYAERRRELLIELASPNGHDLRPPASISEFLYDRRIGYTPLRPLRKAA